MHHILIGHSGSYLASPPQRSVDEALLLSKKILSKYHGGLDFSALAIDYSDDPSAPSNKGSLGWVEWGLTATEFQNAAFNLSINDVSEPVLTPFGYHIIYVESIRPSNYDKMTPEEFNNAVVNLSKRTIRNKLRPAALTYDSTVFVNHKIVFNINAINNLVNAYTGLKSSSNKSLNKQINIADVVASLIQKDVLFVRDGLGFGPLWLVNKVKDIPVSRHPSLDNDKNTISIIKNFILQEIATINGKKEGVDNSFAYKKRSQEIINSILYDSYLKFIINDVEKIDSLSIKEYYKKNKNNFLTRHYFIVDELRFRSKSIADSIKNIINVNTDFSLYNNKNLQIVFNKDLKIAKHSHPALYNAASIINKNTISDVLSSFGGNFSIFKIKKELPPSIQKLSSVYSKINSTLIKEQQEYNKLNKINLLLKKYKIKENKEILF